MMEQESDAHHQISKSRNDPLNIYSYVYANQGDPAFVVCYMFGYHALWVNLTYVSDSFQNEKIIY